MGRTRGDLPEQESAGLLLATQLAEADGLERRLELKPGGVAVHWRDQPAEEVQEVRNRIQQLWSPLLEESPLRLLEFDGGIEIRVSEWSKGTAVETILKEVGSGAAIAYLGDDTTDEDAFRALQGRGLSVLVEGTGAENGGRLVATSAGTATAFSSRMASRKWRRTMSTTTGRLINVSNRLPVVIKKQASGPRVERSSGGLATALDSVWRQEQGVWIGWAGTTQNQEVEALVAKASRPRAYRLKPVSLSEDEVAKFYSGFANEIIWPLFHDCRADAISIRTTGRSTSE